MLAKKLLLLTALFAGGVITSSAQSYYDDDIYYNPSKDKKATQVKSTNKSSVTAAQTQYNYNPAIGGHDFQSADSYVVTSTSSRDVDEYNRRGAYAPVDTTAVSSGENDDFTYTRRIEKYHDGDIIAKVNDPDLVEYYYSSQPEVNIIINAPGYGWGGPWGYNYYAWSYPWYAWNSPWYWNGWDMYWGPSWSWGWGGPGWSWGPSWSWGWGGPAWRPGWGGPGWGPAWAYNPGAYTPSGRRPSGIRNGYTGVASSGHNVGGLNPSNRHGITNQSIGNYRPGSTSASRPQNNNYTRPSNSSGTTRNGSYGQTSGNRGQNSYNNNNNYNSNRNYSTPSRSSGSSRGGFSGGGTSGGGSHRGGRR